MNDRGYSIFNHAQGDPKARDPEPAPWPEARSKEAPPAPAQPKRRKKRERGWAVECGLGLFERKLLP